MEEKQVFLSRIFNKPEDIADAAQQDLFPEQLDKGLAPVTFTGSIEESCPKSVTFRDEGKIPFSTPNIKMIYEFPFCTVNVSSVPSNYLLMQTVKGSLEKYHFPDRDIFDQRIDHLYDRVMTMMREAGPRVIQDPDMADMYPQLVFALRGISNVPIMDEKLSRFFRIIVIEADPCDDRVAKAGEIEKMLAKVYGTPEVDDMKEVSPLSDIHRGLYFKDGLRVDLDCTFEDQITLLLPQFFKEAQYIQLRDLIMKHEAVKDRNPRIDEKNPHLYNMHFTVAPHICGDVLIMEAFKEDLAQIPVKPYRE